MKNISDISHISNRQIHTKSISRYKNSNAEKTAKKKVLCNVNTPSMHISLLKMCSHSTLHYRQLQRECKQFCLYSIQIHSNHIDNSSSSDHQQKKPNRKTCIQNKSKALSADVWKCPLAESAFIESRKQWKNSFFSLAGFRL